MPNLMSHLKRVAEQKPQATYYNVDMIKYQVSIHPSIHSYTTDTYSTYIQYNVHTSNQLMSVSVSQVSADGIQSTPLNLAVSWRGDANNTDLRIDYKYNTEAMAAPMPLHNIHFLVPVEGGVAKVQTMIPTATW